ncbi:MAG TPA: type II toxin-antitoxin system RelE/ParE family toxin [Thermoanaerobaculia bacterium]|nr:type II toxin-antitoxin system RelE/ParE family toxin [Thermoanaerobaculia bacterium]
MPHADVGYFQEDKSVPVLDWLRELQQRDRRAYAKCVARIQRLAQEGHALRRPEADYLRDGIYELRARQGRVNYRILYFFHGQNVVILANGLTKKDEVPTPRSSEPSAEKRLSSRTRSFISMRKPMAKKTHDAIKILDRLTGDDPELREMIAEEAVNLHVARMIYDARIAAGLTQKQLADMIGTQQSVIARLEDADYEGHSLSMLRRIAEALDQKLEVRFVPNRAA